MSADREELEELLRSAHCIALRHGEGTAWDRFAASIQNAGIGSITARTYRILPDEGGEIKTVWERLKAVSDALRDVILCFGDRSKISIIGERIEKLEQVLKEHGL